MAASIEQHLTSLEANYIDRDAEYSNRFNELEALRVTHMTDDSDVQITALEKATAEVMTWRLDMEGIVDDVKL
jgi:hypothetical protein